MPPDLEFSPDRRGHLDRTDVGLVDEQEAVVLGNDRTFLPTNWDTSNAFYKSNE